MPALVSSFNESCVVLPYPCTAGSDKAADPCNCQKFYECQTDTYGFILRSCSGGLYFNHLNNQCENENDIAIKKKLCVPDKSWMRCANVSDNADLPALSFKCSGSTFIPKTTTTSSTTTNLASPAAGPDNTDNTGAIVGGIIGGLLVVAIIVAIVVYLVKKGKPLRHYGAFLSPRLKKPVANPEYGHQDEQYAEIGHFDKMNDGVYIDASNDQTMTRPAVPDRQDVSLSIKEMMATKANDIGLMHEEVAYDNPGYTRDSDTGDVTISASRRTTHEEDAVTQEEHPDTRYFSLNNSVLEVPEGRSYSSLFEAKPEGAGLTDAEGYQIPTPKEVLPYVEVEDEDVHVNPTDGL